MYICTIVSLLVTVDAPKLSSHFLDDVAFRAAWITLAQVPLLYFLSTKRGPLNLLAGLSHERISWIHRWVGRALFVSATTHMAIMMSSISVNDLMRSPGKAMSVVRYGAGAYGTLVWIALSSILPVRRWSYRVFYINHWAMTLVFLWILSHHVPRYARLPIYASVAIVAFDKCLACYGFLWNNVSVRPLKRRFAKFRKEPGRQVLAMGHPVKMMTPFITNLGLHPKESATIIRICDAPLAWRPGQHVRLYLPKLGMLEIHPFTPATCSEASSAPFPAYKHHDAEHNGLLSSCSTPPTNDMVLMIRSHSGLTKRLADYYSKWLSLPCPNASRPCSSLTAYIDGPYGSPPTWEDYENITLIASSTGVSFILSILEYLEQLCFNGHPRLRTQHIRFIWANRHIEPQFEASVMDLLSKHSAMLRESDIMVEAEFYATCPQSEERGMEPEMREYDPFAHLRRPRRNYFAGRPPLRIRNPNALDDEEDEDEEEEDLKHVSPVVSEVESCLSYESDASTLIDQEERPIISDRQSTLDELDTSCWSRMPSLRFPRATPKAADSESCQCGLIRYQQRKTGSKRQPEFITRFYGSRPNIPHIVSVAASRTSTAKTMVAVCSNAGVAMQAKSAVARMNLDFAMGRRERGVDIHTEGFM